jgi:hypothetical protein
MNLATIKRSSFVLGVVGLFGAFSTSSDANGNVPVVTLNDDNARVFIDPHSQSGAFDWFVDTQDYLAQQWLWYRVGSTAESSIDTLTLLSVQQGTPFQATLLYTNSNLGFDLSVSYTLDGGPAGSGNADLGEQIKVNNYSGANLDFHLFLYSDFDLGGTAGGDQVTQLFNSPIGYISATQVDGSDLNQTTVNRGGDHSEASFGNVTLLKLNDGGPTILSDSNGATPGTGDANYTFQWDQNIAAGGTLLISVDKRLDLVPIPEPTTAALTMLGVFALASTCFRKRN